MIKTCRKCGASSTTGGVFCPAGCGRTMREAPAPTPPPRHRCRVEIPACWHDLVQVNFPDDLSGITSEKNCKGANDPDPHYDDSRAATVRCSCGARIQLSLCSGQSNYFGGCTVDDQHGRPVYEVGANGEPVDDYGDWVATGSNGVDYDLEIITVPQGGRPRYTQWLP